MNFWLPYVIGNSGSDVSTYFLTKGLKAAGHDAIAHAFPHNLQYAPWCLRTRTPPPGTDVIITNTWNGFAFHRPTKVNITVERLFVLDPCYRTVRSVAQAVFHEVLVRHFVTRSLETADACVAVSEYSAKTMAQRLKLPRPKTILNAVDINFFTPAAVDTRLTDRRSRPFRLLFVGNLTRRKGADLLVEIMQLLGPRFELQYTSGLRDHDRGQRPANMHNLGKLSLEQVRSAYRNADALLFPSRLEGLPRSVMESFACGTPVIAADASSLSEVVADGKNGVLCPPEQTESFATAVEAMAEDPSTWQDMVIAARSTAEQRFSLDRMIGEYITLATGLTKHQGRATPFSPTD